MMKSIKHKLHYNEIVMKFMRIPLVADTIIIITLGLITSFIFHNFLFVLGEPFRPGWDSYNLDFPLRLLAWETITNGEWPLWNPYNSGGINLLGQPFNFIIYPLYDLIYLFDKDKMIYVLSLVQVFHMLLALTGMFFLLKYLTKDRLIGLWGAILYGFSYPVVNAFVVGQLLSSFAYLPWGVLFLYTIEKRPIPLNIAGLSLIMFFMVGGGFPQWSLYALLLMFLFLLTKYFPYNKETMRKFVTRIFIYFSASLLAFVLGSIEFFPFLEQNIHGARASRGLGMEIDSISALLKPCISPLLSLRLFTPDIFLQNFRELFPDPEVFELDSFNSFFGISTVLLALSSFFVVRKKLLTWKLMFIVIFIMALGVPFMTVILSFLTNRANLVHTRIGGFLPFVGVILAANVLKKIIVEERISTVVTRFYLGCTCVFLLLLLCATIWGENFFMRAGKIQDTKSAVQYIQKELWIGITFVFAYFVVILLYSKRWLNKKVFLLLLCVLAITEVVVKPINRHRVNLSTRPSHEFFESTESERLLDDLLGENKNRYRVHITSTRIEEIVHYLGGPYMHYFPNANIVNKFYETNAYVLNMQKDVGQTITLNKWGYFLRMGDIILGSSLPSILSTKYVIAPQELDLTPYLHPSKQSRTIKVFTDGPCHARYNLKIVEIVDIPQRFFFPEKVIGGLERENIFQQIQDPLFNPRDVTYFEDSILTKSFDTSRQKVLNVSVPNPNRVTVDVSTESPGILVANNFWHKWWRVKVNGVLGKVYRVNYNFQAVEVPEGESNVEFYCLADSLEFGKYFSLSGITILLYLFVVGSSKKRILTRQIGKHEK